MCGIFLAGDEAIAIELQKQDSGYEARTLLTVEERVVAQDARRIGSGHIDNVSGLGVGKLLLGTDQRRLEQATMAQACSSAM